MADLIGQSFGRYHILEQLGEGGMATVYKAYDTRLETDVAVKVIRTDNILPSVMERALKRFEREAKALARLMHPNIVKVTDYGEHEGKPYLVMPYLPGGTLKQRLGKPVPWQQAIQLLRPIAEALDYAHSQNMIHRDVKPSNILLTERGQPMLTDFGIAKILDVEETMDLTGTSATVGTPEYMAPEQVTAKTIDHRADIYALGVVLYEMVTGRKPFIADTPMAVLFKHATEPLPRPKQLMPSLPDAVEKILLKALAKHPDDRYQSMAEMGAAFGKTIGPQMKIAHIRGGIGHVEAVKNEAEQETTKEEKSVAVSRIAVEPADHKAREKTEREVIARAGGTSEPAAQPQRVRQPGATLKWVMIGIIGICCLAIGTVGITYFNTIANPAQMSNLPTEEPTVSDRPDATATESVLWTVSERTPRNDAGPLLAYDDGDDVVVAALDGTIVSKIPGKAVSCLFPPSLSPDGSLIAVFGGEIQLMDVQDPGTVVSTIKTIGLPIGLSWSPGGDYVVFGDGSNGPEDLYVATSDGSNVRKITNYGDYTAFPDWSPDGTEIAFTANNGIDIINQHGELRNIVTDPSGTSYAPRWSPDGTKIAYVFDHVGTDGYYDYSQVFIVDLNGDLSPRPISDPLEGWQPGAVGWAYPVAWADNKTVLALNYYDGWYSLSIDRINPQILDQQIAGSCVDLLP